MPRHSDRFVCRTAAAGGSSRLRCGVGGLLVCSCWPLTGDGCLLQLTTACRSLSQLACQPQLAFCCVAVIVECEGDLFVAYRVQRREDGVVPAAEESRRHGLRRCVLACCCFSPACGSCCSCFSCSCCSSACCCFCCCYCCCSSSRSRSSCAGSSLLGTFLASASIPAFLVLSGHFLCCCDLLCSDKCIVDHDRGHMTCS